MKNEINIGEMIQEELLSQGRSVAWLADQLACDRANIYKLFKRRSVNTDQLLRISQALHRNFFSVYIAELRDR